MKLLAPIASSLGSADSVLISTAGNPAKWLPAKKLSPAYVVSPDEVGSDVTAYLQAILTLYAGGTITFSPGTYNGIGRLIVPAATVVELMPGVVLRARALTGAEQAQQSSDGRTWAMVQLTGGARLRGEGRLDGNRSVRGNSYGVLIADTSERTKVRGIEITNMGNSGIFFTAAHRVDITETTIWDCYGKGIEGVISRQARVHSNRVEDCYHGIQWWGDDANGWCSDWTITDNIVYNMGNQANGADGGGIWGARGKGHTITGNTVKKGFDVGIDLEITTDCTVAGNTVTDFKKAGLSVFCASRRNSFTGNIVSQGAGYGSCFKIYGRVDAYPAQSDPTNFDISVSGGSMYSESSADVVVCDEKILEGFALDNVQIETTSTTARAVRMLDANFARITNNRIKYSSGDAINIEGGSDSEISGNRIRYLGLNPASARGIWLVYRSGAYPAKRNHVAKNKLFNCGLGIHDDCWGDNSVYNQIEDNMTPVVTTAASEPTYAAIVINNRNANGVLVDNTNKKRHLHTVANLTDAQNLFVSDAILLRVQTDSVYGDTDAVYLKTPTTLERLSKTAK